MTKTKIERIRKELIEKHGDMELLKVFSKATRALVATVKLSTAKIMNTADMKEIQRIIKEGHPRQLMVA